MFLTDVRIRNAKSLVGFFPLHWCLCQDSATTTVVAGTSRRTLTAASLTAATAASLLSTAAPQGEGEGAHMITSTLIITVITISLTSVCNSLFVLLLAIGHSLLRH